METGVTFETAEASLQALYDEALRLCAGNLQSFGGLRVLVEGGGYSKLWLETQPMGGEMYCKRDLTVGRNNVEIFMACQRPDGRLPGSILWAEGRLVPEFNKMQGFCFPKPALELYYWLGRDESWLRKVYDCLEAFDAYLWRVRDSDGDGLLESWCVYDTGEDNAVRYGRAPNYWAPDTPPIREDTVPMASMDFMSYSYACRDTLAKIAAIRGTGRTEYWREKAAEVALALRRGLWDEGKAACYDRDKTGRVIPVLTHNNLRCMYWGSFAPDMAAAFVARHLTNPGEFWTALPLPSVAANDPAFRNAPENNWSGQAEGLTYQRAITALENYGCDKLVTALGKRLLRAISVSGNRFTQQYDPFTGAPSLVGQYSHAPLPPDSAEPPQNGYGPTVLAALEYIAHIRGVQPTMGSVRFALGRAEKPYRYSQRYLGRVYAVESDGRTAAGFLDGQEIFRHSCGVCVVTDEGGAVQEIREIE